MRMNVWHMRFKQIYISVIFLSTQIPLPSFPHFTHCDYIKINKLPKIRTSNRLLMRIFEEFYENKKKKNILEIGSKNRKKKKNEKVKSDSKNK